MPEVTGSERELSFAEAINEATFEAMASDPSVICFGLGVTDPGAIFGTTKGLETAFGPERVFDMPTSENAMTGVAVGAAISGLKPIMTHQRLDFFLLAMDQLVNSAAKWHFMFGGQFSVPLTIRLIIGRGWGQGPTHSQNLHAWFAHIPGLKVVMPTSPHDAKELLLASIFDPNPVVFLEHRWLHDIRGPVPPFTGQGELGKARVAREGTDITIVSSGYLTLEAIAAADSMATMGISCEVLDLRSIKPIDWQSLLKSVRKTGRLLVVDSGSEAGSVANDVIARVSMEIGPALRTSPARLTQPNVPEPTSHGLTDGFHVRSKDIIRSAAHLVGLDFDLANSASEEQEPHDVPGSWFKGPF